MSVGKGIGNNQPAIANIGATGQVGKTQGTNAKSGLDELASVTSIASQKAPEHGTGVSLAAAEAVGLNSDHPAAIAA